MSKGAPAEKLVVGMAFFGQTWTGLSAAWHSVGDQAISVGTSGPFTKKYGIVAYFEVRLFATERMSSSHPGPYQITVNCLLCR